jgi:hypothetical protein
MSKAKQEPDPRWSLVDCVTNLVRTGKDAQLLLGPLREFCLLEGFDDDECRRGKCEEARTHRFLFRQIDELHQLFEKWDHPEFPARVPDALAILDRLFKVLDDGIFEHDVGTWSAVWFPLRDALILRNPATAPAWWKRPDGKS